MIKPIPLDHVRLFLRLTEEERERRMFETKTATDYGVTTEFTPSPVGAGPRRRLLDNLHALPLLSLQNPGERAVIQAKCFKIRMLCWMILERMRSVEAAKVEPCQDPSEVGLLAELSRMDAPEQISALWLATVCSRASMLHDLLTPRSHDTDTDTTDTTEATTA